MDEFGGGSVEDETTLMEHQEAGIGVGLMGREEFHPILGEIEVMHRQDKGILEAVRDHDGAGVGDVALLHDELDDGG